MRGQTAREARDINSAKIAIEKYRKLRDEQQRIVASAADEKARLEKEIAQREAAIIVLRKQLDDLPVTIDTAKRKAADLNRHIENWGAQRTKAMEKGRLRARHSSVKDELRKLEDELRKQS